MKMLRGQALSGGLHATAPGSDGRHLIDELLGDDLGWVTSEALCGQVDSEAWFPDRGGNSRVAKRLCQGCPLLAPCAEYAATHDEYGIWGGTSSTQRRRGTA